MMSTDFKMGTDVKMSADFNWKARPATGPLARSLEALWEDLVLHQTSALLVIAHDRILFERYTPGASRNLPHYTASLAKALVGGLSLMIAMGDGLITPEDPATRFIPSWFGQDRKRRITIRQLSTHTSGLEDAEEGDLPHKRLTGWKGDFWNYLEPPRDPFTLARDVAPVLDEPGSQERYSNPGMAMLSYCVTAALRHSHGSDREIRSLLRRRVMEPIGVPEQEWSCGYGKTTEVDGLPLVASWGGGAYSPDAAARIGRLLLRHGEWENRRLIPAAVAAESTRHAGMRSNSGLGWWVNRTADGGRFWECLPHDAFYGAGAGHQLLLVAPSLDLIVVRMGQSLDGGLEFSAALERHLVQPLMDVLANPASAKAASAKAAPVKTEAGEKAPCPPSKVIRRLVFDPPETVLRYANDSDRFPITWADDDSQYTAWSDGNGFNHSPRLSMGFARLVGTPENLHAEDIPSPSGDAVGDGQRGLKGSGLVCIGGTLYLWASNADGHGSQAKLGWSCDHARTWTWADWVLEEFGYLAIVNYGMDYADARNEYVYMVAHDNPSAYRPADRFILIRAPKGKLRSREDYRWYAGQDHKGQAAWSQQPMDRVGIFHHPGRCLRSQVSYHAPTGRYLWWQQNPREPGTGDVADTRFEGGFGIYDSPELWGPWTTVFFTPRWDVGPGETASLPTKWMSVDGRVLYLVFSGEDNFSMRRARLEFAEIKE